MESGSCERLHAGDVGSDRSSACGRQTKSCIITRLPADNSEMKQEHRSLRGLIDSYVDLQIFTAIVNEFRCDAWLHTSPAILSTNSFAGWLLSGGQVEGWKTAVATGAEPPPRSDEIDK